jgi:hypothetical protein
VVVIVIVTIIAKIRELLAFETKWLWW